MPEPLTAALARVRELVLDDQALVRALGDGPAARGRGPRWRRVELRYVDLKAGRHLQVTRYDETQAHVTNHPDAGGRARRAVRGAVRQLARRDHRADPPAAGDQERRGGGRRDGARPPWPSRSAATTAPSRGCCPRTTRCWSALGISDRTGTGEAEPAGEVPPGRGVPPASSQAAVDDAIAAGRLRPSADDAAAGGRPRLRQRLPHLRRACLADPRARAAGAGGRRRRQGAVAPAQHRGRRAARASATRSSSSSPGSTTVELEEPPDVVLALHACDTATDDALARAVALGGAAGAGGAVLPPRHLAPAARARRRPRRTRCSPATASCASGSPTRSPTRCGPRCCALAATGSRWSSSSAVSTPRATP